MTKCLCAPFCTYDHRYVSLRKTFSGLMERPYSDTPMPPVLASSMPGPFAASWNRGAMCDPVSSMRKMQGEKPQLDYTKSYQGQDMILQGHGEPESTATTMFHEAGDSISSIDYGFLPSQSSYVDCNYMEAPTRSKEAKSRRKAQNRAA